MEKRLNILISSAGKRVVFTHIFMKNLAKWFPGQKVFTTDMYPEYAPAGIESDGCFKVPRVTDADYIPTLLDICLRNEVGMVVPTIDTELIILAEHKDLFEKNGIFVIVSDPDFIKISRDKRCTNEYFRKIQIRTPRPIDINNPEFPLFAKPYDGSLSKDLYLIRNKEEITPEIMNHPKLIFMEYIDTSKYKEFSVDMYYGRDHKIKSIVPRERLEIRAGEINKGYTRKNYLVEYIKERMSYLPGVIGCICLQLFYRSADNDVVGIEINPRFGGGYPLSYHAGADYMDLIIREYFLDQTVEYKDDWHNNTLMLRYDENVIIYE